MIWNDDVSKANGGRTKEAFWQRLKGSLDLLFEGVDEQGRELAGGYRGCLIGIAGDLEFFQSWLGFKGATANFPCARCPLHKDELMDWRNTASWRRHTYRKGEDWHQAQGHNHGALFHGKNKLSSLNLLPDIMHTKFVGVDQYAYGSCLHKLIYRHMSLDKIVKQVYGHFYCHKLTSALGLARQRTTSKASWRMQKMFGRTKPSSWTTLYVCRFCMCLAP